MEKQIDFSISDLAYNGLIELLKVHDEYSYVRFSSGKSCCNHSTLQIILDDKIDKDDKILSYKELKLAYNPSNLESFNKITLIYENDTFKVKAETDEKAPNCKSCNHKSEGCNSCNHGKVD